MSDLNAMAPNLPTVRIGDEDVVIKNIKVGKLAAIMVALKPIAHKLPHPGQTPDKSPIDMIGLVVEYTPTVIDVVSLVLGKPKEWVEELDLDQLVDLFSKIVEVNLDFFIQKVLPSVLRAMGQLSGVFQATRQNLTGRLPSNASSPAATGTPTS